MQKPRIRRHWNGKKFIWWYQPATAIGWRGLKPEEIRNNHKAYYWCHEQNVKEQNNGIT